MKLILLVIGMFLLCGNVYAAIGYTEINLIDYDTNKFIHVNSTIPITNYTYELRVGLNWVGMPFNTTIINADQLIKNIPHCERVARRDPITQHIETYGKIPFPPFYAGDNFNVEPCTGYEISIVANTTWVIKCLQPANPMLQYQCFDLNKYIGTNIVRAGNI